MAKARARKKSARRRRAARQARPVSALRAVIGIAVACAVIAGFQCGSQTAQLDRIVRARFEGAQFRVPSRVLSAPTLVYPGADLEQLDLDRTLQRLSYRERAEGELRPGEFRRSPDRIDLFRRALLHPTRPEPSKRVTLSLRGGRIREIRAEDGRELRMLTLEPQLVGSYFGPDREQRKLVHVGEVPPHLIESILAVEDQRYYDHGGVDLRRIVGAAIANLRSGRVTQGGSTLTQQLVKNFFLTPERSLSRKFQEAWMALIVEARYDKDAILESYLNEIYLGQRGATAIHGVGEAARLYYGKEVQEIGIAESALLAGIISSPNGRSPFRHPDAALARRDRVLEMMLEQERIDDSEYQVAVAEPLGVRKSTPAPREGRYFLDFLRRQLPEFFDAETLTSQGLRIYSTLDLRLQRIAARALREELDALEKSRPKLLEGPDRLQGCLVALDPRSGEIRALVGGRDYAESQFDRCSQARRQVGSAFKPFVYAAALEPRDGQPTITLASTLTDSPLSLSTPAGPWTPKNYDGKFRGEVTVGEALARSLNVPTARLGQDIGIPKVVDLAQRVGVESPMPPVPSLALGSADLAPIEVARAYATLAAGGVRPNLRAFEDVADADGRRTDRRTLETRRVLDPGTAFLVTQLLVGVVDHGTARRIRSAGIQGPVAGKTGTTNDEIDAWFAGYTPDLVVVVWVGFDEPRSTGLAASSLALPIWIRFVKEATGGKITGSFRPPREVRLVDVDPVSGARSLAGCPRRETYYFIKGTEPEDICPHVDYPLWQRDRGDRDDEPGRGPREDRRRNWLERLFGL